MPEISSEEFQEWRNHPVTRDFFDKIKEERDGIAEKVLSGQFLGSHSEDHAVIAVQVYDSILNTEYEEGEEE